MSDWRRIDIDAFDPESGRLTSKDIEPPYPSQVTLQELSTKISQLRSLASSGDAKSAVALAVSDPPYSGDESTKNEYFKVVLETLSNVRQADISGIVSGLTPIQQDVLVKYLYKGMSIPEGQKQGGILLAWFERVTQVAGVRPVSHFINDRNTV
ncbi:similar to Saccharomyces cerevisiae YIL062C ARC15 Subunit of the ARP2/3 complex, which is required for the motility and integrity of cortical actin patches [Maudiozyma saulgeensis]|uniref:Actin-related protein 2/3 complex subunit 5 n=1 Tax=Maudiozyma saulgeensis TaxID=1789683 RepID=A0A1X7R2N9_9SACH|nr:similar to Saccharomyces cerevisiae YIL062C ARC15 Subunit of the ARP2/3 complex, which is required for the motility and integrity of cortical actin patches [Kazachstania saulgeensis]